MGCSTTVHLFNSYIKAPALPWMTLDAGQGCTTIRCSTQYRSYIHSCTLHSICPVKFKRMYFDVLCNPDTGGWVSDANWNLVTRGDFGMVCNNNIMYIWGGTGAYSIIEFIVSRWSKRLSVCLCLVCLVCLVPTLVCLSVCVLSVLSVWSKQLSVCLCHVCLVCLPYIHTVTGTDIQRVVCCTYYTPKKKKVTVSAVRWLECWKWRKVCMCRCFFQTWTPTNITHTYIHARYFTQCTNMYTYMHMQGSLKESQWPALPWLHTT